MTKRISVVGLLLVLILVAGGVGYFIGGRQAATQIRLGASASSLMFCTAIHEAVASGDYTAAQKYAARGADSEILAIKNIENYPLLHWVPVIFSRKEKQQVDAIVHRNLTRAQAHFASHPQALLPITTAYLEEIREPDPALLSTPEP